ncbi:hypothetical protein DWW80_11415 [Coprobacillus sp. AF17-17AC]|nr:hypothetical protein DWW80_11415 [Coprobacillus sp. AF17-17AC]
MEKVLEITSNDHIIMIDKLCKRILGHPEILGRIIKGFIKEAKDASLEEIIELIKGKKDQEGNSYFQQLNNVIDIAHHGRVEFDYFCCINLPQADGTMKRIYLDVEIQNVENPGYAPLTRGNDYLSRMITSQNGKEYDYRNYDGMKKTYVIWILPQAAKKRDGHVNRINSKLENVSGSTIERLESYDKSEQIMIYLNKDHNIKDKYEDSDWIKTPLVIFLNNTYDLLIKKEVMKEYGFEEIEKEVKKMCNLGEMIARENIEKGHSIYLNKDHNIKDKYEDSDWIKTPLVIFLNNTYDLLIKKEVMKEYGFAEIGKEVKKMCNLGEMIARENIEKGHSMGLEQGLVQGQKLERIASIKNLMKKMAIPLDKAMDLLDLSSIEKEEMKKHFQS